MVYSAQSVFCERKLCMMPAGASLFHTCLSTILRARGMIRLSIACCCCDVCPPDSEYVCLLSSWFLLQHNFRGSSSLLEESFRFDNNCYSCLCAEAEALPTLILLLFDNNCYSCLCVGGRGPWLCKLWLKNGLLFQWNSHHLSPKHKKVQTPVWQMLAKSVHWAQCLCVRSHPMIWHAHQQHSVVQGRGLQETRKN